MQAKKAPPSATQAELERLQSEQRQQQQEFFKKLETLKASEQGKAYQEFQTKLVGQFLPRYEALAKKSTGGAQVRARLAALELARQAQKKELVTQLTDQLLRENRDLPELAPLASLLRFELYNPGVKPEPIKAKLVLLGKSKEATVQAAALYALAEVTKDGDAKAAVPLYQKLVAQYPTSRYAKLAKGAIFEAENLQVGMVAPEVKGTDHEGRPFLLSDYRGKVVVLDFWGFW